MTAFVDTNILFYAVSSDPRYRAATALLGTGPSIAVQSLNEFALAARRRARRDWPEIETAIAWVLSCCPDPVPLTLPIHQAGLALAQRYRLNLHDSMIVAAAIASGADTLWSEDMQDGLVVDGRLTIRNPF